MPLAKPGDVLQDNQNNSYVIDKYLGEGVTAEVYRATRPDNNQVVAFKILRTDLPAEIIQSFRDEAVILGELAQYSRQRYPNELLHTPLVLGRSKERETPEFLVMEFVTGQPLDELIVSTQGLVVQGREVEALLIARQVLQLLVVLHEDVRRSYVDFQLKNIWWLPEQSLAKVMDWNHVSTRAKEGDTPPGAVNDLIRFGAYLYQLLTGKGAFQTGETEAELANRAGDKWPGVSLGTRTILLKALHPNPQNRYQIAHEFLADIKAMLTMWQQDEDDLYDEASIALRQAKSRTPQSGSDQYTVAQYAASVFAASRAINLFILRSRDIRRVERMRDELTSLTANVSPVWGVGKNYYQLGVYSEALKQWEPEARNLKRLDLWRWVVVAQIGRQKATDLKDSYAPIKALLEEAIAYLDEKEWSLAKGSLQQLDQQAVLGSAFYVFGYEAEAQELTAQARLAENKAQWAKAGDAYTEAAQTLRQIQDDTYLDLLSSELSTPEQLEEKAKLCREHDQGYEKESQAINEFRLRMTKNNQLVSYLKEQLLENPAQTRLLDVALEESDKLPDEEAIHLLATAAFYGRAPEAMYVRLTERQQRQQQIALQQAIEQYKALLEKEQAEKTAAAQLAHQKWVEEQTVRLEDALQAQRWEEVYTVVADMGGDVPSQALSTVLTHFTTAKKERDWPKIMSLGDALSLIYAGEEKEEVKRRMDDARRGQELDLKLAQFNQQLLQKQFVPAQESLDWMQEQINAIHDSNERNLRQKKLDAKRDQLRDLERRVVRELPIGLLIGSLNQNELKALSMKMETELQSIEKQLNTVVSQNEALEKRNEQLSQQLKNSTGNTTRGGGGWVMALVLLLLMIVLLMAGGYLLKATQIDPLATTVANLSAGSPVAVAAGTLASPQPDGTVIAVIEETSTFTPTPSPIPPSPTPTPTNTPEPPTPTPIPLVSESLRISSIPAPPRDFTIPETDADGNVQIIDPLTITGVTGGDLDTVFDWPTFELALSNGWLFDLSGETVMLKHEGQVETLPLQIQMTANSMADPLSSNRDVMRSWVIPNIEGAEVTTISIDGNFLKQDGLVPGGYTATWSIPDAPPLFTSEPIMYTPPLTVTWLTATPLRTRPEWIPRWDKDLPMPDQEVPVKVYGFICNRYTQTPMFLAVTLDSDPAQIYWLRSSGAKELATNDDFQILATVFDGIDECIAR